MYVQCRIKKNKTKIGKWIEQSTGKEIPPIMGTRVEIASRIAAALTSGLASGTILHKKMDYGDIYQQNI